jgi:hypothetical protein
MSKVVDIQSAPRTFLDSTREERASQWGTFEPFVDEHVVAGFLGIAPRRVLEMARKRIIPSHPIGGERKTWRFRISEIDAHFSLADQRRIPATIGSAVPVTQGRKRVNG